MHLFRRQLAALAFAALCLTLATPSFAQAPHPFEFGMQTPGSPVAQDIEWLHNLVLVIITVTLILLGFRLIGRDFMLRRTVA